MTAAEDLEAAWRISSKVYRLRYIGRPACVVPGLSSMENRASVNSRDPQRPREGRSPPLFAAELNRSSNGLGEPTAISSGRLPPGDVLLRQRFVCRVPVTAPDTAFLR